MKTCTGCGGVFPATKHHFHGKGAGRLASKCKSCMSKYMADRYKDVKNSPELYEKRRANNRAWVFRDRYGIDVNEYHSMLESQDGGCAVCGSTDTGRPNCEWFCVDHDHKTGKVRGILCHPCNSSLGLLKDDPVVIESLLAYLERS